MNEIKDAWNERNPDAAFTSPVASQEDDDDDYYSSRYNTQDSQDSTVEGYDRDDNTAATGNSQDFSQDFSQDDDKDGIGKEIESKEKKLQRLKAEATSSSLGKVADANILPVVIKSGAYDKPMLLCECTDTEMNFDGDTGAIGRMVTDRNGRSIVFDLKGRQYRGKLRKGPTVLVINTAPPVGAKPDEKEIPARVECVINEFCDLKYEKDLLSDLKGNYTGLYDLADELINEVPLDKYGRAAEKKKAAAAAKKRKSYDDDDDFHSDEDGENKPKKKAPKISTGRTQAMKGKDGKKKRKSISRKGPKKK